MEWTRILLNSKTPRFTTGLANSSGELARNLMDHCMGGGAYGRLPDLTQASPTGRRPNGIYLPRFRNVKDQHPGFLRGYAFQGGGYQDGWGRGNEMPGFGKAL